MIKSSHTANLIEVGCDEAGRGSLAGPVVSCSVIFPKKIKIKEINDSKLLSKNKRIKLEKIIREKAIDYSFGIANVEEIDKINILNASILSMHRSLSQIKNDFDFLNIDCEGNDYKILKSINLKFYKPELINIEVYDDTKNNIYQYLHQNGYELLIAKSVSHIFKRKISKII